LEGNVALAVGKDIDYSCVQEGDERYIVATELLPKIFSFSGDTAFNGKEFRGENLLGMRYDPLFRVNSKEFENNERAFTVQPADFVTTTDGTGVVHTAVMYGEDDYRLGEELGLPQFHTVSADGRFVPDVEGIAGEKAKTPETEEKIFTHLRSRGLLFKIEPYVHEYPHCWRCGTPLLYYARHSWFVRMSSLRGALMKENAKINWIPENLREGRFGAWLSEAKDWAISRERYWGTPLPIWECDRCPERKVVTGDADFAELKPKNRYILMRHGYSESNAKDMLDSHGGKKTFPLTKRGEREAREAARKLAKEKVDVVFASDVYRAKQTAEIVSEALGAPAHIDPRLREINVGSLAGTSHRKFDALPEKLKFLEAVPGGESRNDVRRRVYAFLKECEEKYDGQTILVVSHDDPLWMMLAVMNGWDSDEAIAWAKRKKGALFPFAGFSKADYRVIPRDELGVKDYHKPYIDEIAFPCACGGRMRRAPEVMDVWFDSGSMPWAQKGYLYAPKAKRIDRSDFPADYIAEGVDQTRGWFYTMLAIGVLLEAGSPYKTAMSLGLLLDSKGQKMSKSKGNVVDPWEMMERHGVDVARWFFFTVNPPGEPKRFDERELVKVSRQVFMILYNSFAFLDLYGKQTARRKIVPTHVLDRWVMARLHATIQATQKAMDAYEIGDAARAIQGLVDDLSRWHIRRSRKRFQRPVSQKDREQASAVLAHVMREIAKLLAPFTPFFAEALYKSLSQKAADSVHLASWPAFEKKLFDAKLLSYMEETRRIASLTLAKRAELGIKVRQPLAELRVKSTLLKGVKAKECLLILKDEVNVKRVVFDPSLTEEITLDTAITPELKEEGLLRELVRAIQELRQEAGFVPKDKVRVYVSGAGLGLIERHGDFLKREVNARSIEFQHLVKKAKAETTVDLDEGHAWIGVL
jgi:isoleucyl-tRNA synthetase